MEHSELLNTLAQIALGTLGFTGVVVALKHSSNEWNNFEKIRFQALVTTTLTALIGSLLPQIISIESQDNWLTWRLANLGIGLMHLVNFGSIIYTAIKYKIKPKPQGLKDIMDIIVGPTLIILHIVAALGYIPWLKLLLVIGVLQQLYIGISNFLIFISWKKS
ncbi:MAG: hypothetical protein MK211_12075 [Flavobacteriales bacterium]|jgi:hypothetical protein|uniref:hypothetical protein n=1 Tax=Candidatus Ulvibacter alkanivorans TaxID=2267620 RepID=UPI000DF222D8|nr:hypothetical protein [Candidatus Ulvibacter alkanivorans]MCH2490877.1 hypothetical protein [Flavobacteriales bacterium]